MKKMFALVLCLIVFFANGNVMAENTYLQNGNVYKCITDNGEVWEYELHKNGDLTLNNQILQENVTEFGYGVNCIISVVNDDEVYKTRIGDFKPLYIASGYRYFIWDGKGFIKYFRNSEKLYQVGSSTSTPSNWAEEEIEESISSGIYTMPAMENYQANITRQQFCELVTLTYEKLSGKNPKTGDTKFEDTDNIDVLKAADLGIVEGYGNGKFCPDEWITREQICTMIVRMLKRSIKNIDTDYNNNAFVDIDEISDWAIPSVNFAYDKGIMKGVETLKIAPLNNTTCEEALLLMYRVYCKYSNSKNNDIQSSNTTKSGISETDFLDMKDLDNEIENAVSDYTIYDDIIPEYNIQDVIDIVNEFAENKLESGEIEDYYTDEYSVWMKLNSGLEYVYTPNVEGLDLGSEELSVITCQPFNTDYGEKDKSFKTNGEKATDGIARTMQTNFKNIVFEHNYDDYEVTLDVIKNFTDNQIILWHGHGGYNKMKHSYIYVGSVCDEYLLWTDLNYYRDHIEYEKDYLAGRIVFSSSGRVAITHKFIDEYVDSMNNSFVYLGTCLSGKDSKLADSFLDKGAKAVIGNSDSIRTVYNQAMIRKVCANLMSVTEDGVYMTLAEAVDNAKEELGENDGSTERDAYPIIFGDDSMRLCQEEQFSVGGTVVNENGNPVKNAVVKVVDEDGYIVLELDTNRNGGFEATLFPGCYEFTAEKDGYYSSETIGIEIDRGNKWVFLGELNMRKKKDTEESEKSDSDLFGGVEEVNKSVVVKFQTNGGEIDVSSKKVIVGEAYGDLPVPVKDGHSFYGWYKEPNHETEIRNDDIVEISKNHTLYAKWYADDGFLNIKIIKAYGTLMTGQNYPCTISVYSKNKKLMEQLYGEPYATFLFEIDEDPMSNPGYVVFETTINGSAYGTVCKISDEDFYDKPLDLIIQGYLIYGWKFDINELK